MRVDVLSLSAMRLEPRELDPEMVFVELVVGRRLGDDGAVMPAGSNMGQDAPVLVSLSEILRVAAEPSERDSDPPLETPAHSDARNRVASERDVVTGRFQAARL